MDEQRFKQFEEIYRKHLKAAIEEFPNEYRIKDSTIVADRMITRVMIDGITGVNINDSHAFKRSAKELGINNTYKAWRIWLNGNAV